MRVGTFGWGLALASGGSARQDVWITAEIAVRLTLGKRRVIRSQLICERPSMAKLDAAASALKAALDKLEAEASALADLRAQAGRDAQDIARMSAEREHLLARVAELEDENRSLAGITEEVEGKLDGAIAEIRAALSR
jgi:chromosome segregation ATPase